MHYIHMHILTWVFVLKMRERVQKVKRVNSGNFSFFFFRYLSFCAMLQFKETTLCLAHTFFSIAADYQLHFLFKGYSFLKKASIRSYRASSDYDIFIFCYTLLYFARFI